VGSRHTTERRARVIDSNTTDGKSPADRLLELVVFGPAGLAVTIVEEFPRLVEKGRHRVEGQVHTARLVGQFAFQMGRRQIEETLAHLGRRPDAPRSPGTADDDAHSGLPAEPVDASGTVAPAPGAGSAKVVPPSDGATPTAGAEEAPVEAPATQAVWVEGGVANGSGVASLLAIPGYDSLSASQVVQRLEGLSAEELEEVRDHEADHRQRRTILHRIEQLLTGGDGVQAQ
jgi:hypothetical protein